MMYYGLDGLPCSMEEAARLISSPERQIAKDRIDGVLVSTVFLVFNHNWQGPDMPPLLYETMIFGGTHDQWQRRYTSRDEALDGHNEAVEMVQNARSGVDRS